jgi:glutathione peroxidase
MYPVMEKVDVNGPSAHPLFSFLREALMHGHDIKWNFGKFLINRAGVPVEAFEPKTNPVDIAPAIERMLLA